MAAPHSLEDTLRVHDIAFMQWLSGLHVDYGTAGGLLTPARDNVPILRRFVAPSRVASAVADWLVQMGWISESDAAVAAFKAQVKASGLSVLPLPIASVQRGDPVLDPEISGVPKSFRRRTFDATTGKWTIHPFPGHYRTDYTVTFWCHKMFTANFIREWVMSEIGVLGCADNERLIAVTHDDPVGVKSQSLKMTGSSDMSNLEGSTEPRYIRFQFIFSLRTLFYRLPSDPVYPVETISAEEVQFTDQQCGMTGDGGASLSIANRSLSDNLFQPLQSYHDIAALWPTTGTASAAHSKLLPSDSDLSRTPPHTALRCSVTTENDGVEICERLLAKDDDGYGLYAIWFEYLASEAVTLQISNRDYDADGEPETTTLLRERSLPAARRWTRVSQFVPANKDAIIVSLVGVGTASVAHLANVQVRRVLPYTRLWCFHTATVALEKQLSWTDLEAGAYYLVVPILMSGVGTFSVDNATAGSTDTQTETYNSAENLGSCLLQQSLDGTMMLRFPSTTTLTSVWLVRYYAGVFGSG